jgi:hypothetical protein
VRASADLRRYRHVSHLVAPRCCPEVLPREGCASKVASRRALRERAVAKRRCETLPRNLAAGGFLWPPWTEPRRTPRLAAVRESATAMAAEAEASAPLRGPVAMRVTTAPCVVACRTRWPSFSRSAISTIHPRVAVHLQIISDSSRCAARMLHGCFGRGHRRSFVTDTALSLTHAALCSSSEAASKLNDRQRRHSDEALLVHILR